MSKKYCLVVVEGPHDQAIVGKLLRMSKLEKFNGDPNKLDSFWLDLKPDYPRKNDLYKPMSMPYIYTSDTHSVAVCNGEGRQNVPKEAVTIYLSYGQSLHSIGLIVDADEQLPPKVMSECLDALKNEAKAVEMAFPSVPNIPGTVIAGKPRIGMYVLPDNVNPGTLDTVLVQCAAEIYPGYKLSAEYFLNHVLANVSDKHTERLKKPLSREKSLVSSIVSVLKPGRGNAPSIHDDNWISDRTLKRVSELTSLKQFIADLLELSSNEPAIPSSPAS